jgi:hypothetical protein
VSVFDAPARRAYFTTFLRRTRGRLSFLPIGRPPRLPFCRDIEAFLWLVTEPRQAGQKVISTVMSGTSWVGHRCVFISLITYHLLGNCQ